MGLVVPGFLREVKYTVMISEAKSEGKPPETVITKPLTLQVTPVAFVPLFAIAQGKLAVLDK